MGGNITKAMRELVRARSINPRDETTLGRIAACLHLEKKTDELKKLADEIEKFDPKAGTFYQVLAERLEERRHYDAAEKYFKKAIELRPMVPWPQNNLGMLYMRMGREEEAKPILEKAFDADEFNVRVDNTLKVLRHLEKYQTVKTEHFILRFDPEEDKLLGQTMATYLEDIYEKLAEKFKYRPKGPFVIEVFNSHEMFSGRVIAVPDLHTIGACTGRMVAMVSPRGKGIRRPFNWARVLRHELVHIFNLEQTNFLIPHWYTEGLAVISEGYPRPQPWNQLLLKRVPERDNLLTLDTIDMGFIRPESQEQWHQAYCQSQLYVEFITDTYGKDKIGGLLAAFADGMDTGSAIQKVCKVDKVTFEKGYLKHLDKVVGEIRGKPAEKAMTFVEARKAHQDDPNNNDVAARLAEFYLKRDKAQARKLADTVLGRKKGHPLACYVKAQLLIAAGEDEQALKLLEEATSDPKVFEPKATALLAKIYFEGAKFDRAAELLERARKAEPYESKWMSELVRVYAQNGDKEKHVKLLAELAPTDADDIDTRKELARMLLDLKKYADAEKYAREAMEIDVLDPDAQQSLGSALAGQKKYKAACEAFQVAITGREQRREIDKADVIRLKLAEAYRDNGQKKEALNEVTKILAHDENHARAKELKLQLEK
jgi:tetratricopeptide (TPR) repeat protein